MKFFFQWHAIEVRRKVIHSFKDSMRLLAQHFQFFSNSLQYEISWIYVTLCHKEYRHLYYHCHPHHHHYRSLLCLLMILLKFDNLRISTWSFYEMVNLTLKGGSKRSLLMSLQDMHMCMCKHYLDEGIHK